MTLRNSSVSLRETPLTGTLLASGDLTVTSQTEEWAPSLVVTVTLAVPSALPVIFPFSSTVTMEVLLLFQVTSASATSSG